MAMGRIIFVDKKALFRQGLVAHKTAEKVKKKRLIDDNKRGSKQKQK